MKRRRNTETFRSSPFGGNSFAVSAVNGDMKLSDIKCDVKDGSVQTRQGIEKYEMRNF